MKRSRSGTKSRRRKPRRPGALGLVVALLAVAAFITSFVLGLDRPPARSRAEPDTSARTPIVVPDSRTRVQVLNGSRKSGLARLATDQLRAAGFDVVSIGNARAHRDESVVFDRTGNPELAERVAAALGIKHVETQIDTTLYLEVTVVLGADWPAPTP